MTWEQVIADLEVTAEIYSRKLSKAGATMFLHDLRSRFTPDQVLSALAKCRLELKFFPSVAEIASRISDGRPEVEQAWAMIPKDEYGSVVWTDEMAIAFGPARALLLEGDMVAARMAFKETYSALVAESRARGRAPVWQPSFGLEKSGREAALRDAVDRGRISIEDARRHVPELGEPRTARPRQLTQGDGELRRIGEMLTVPRKEP